MPHSLSALVSMNGFKGSLSNVEASRTVSEALESLAIPTRLLPIGDGGTGTISTVQSCLGGVLETLEVTGPLGKPAFAQVLCFPDTVNPTTLYIESSDTCSLRDSERDVMRATSFGLGELIMKCLDRWTPSLKKIYVGLGDSSTSDVGMGMLYALGYIFQDQGGKTIWGNATGLRLARTVRVPSPEPFRGVKFTVLCDVLNPLCGRNGSARVFSPQKGATTGEVSLIEQGMENFAKLIATQTGREVASLPMTGSAGGLATAFHTFLKAELVHGARFLLDWIHFDTLLARHTVLITGEGRTDAQTIAGKAPMECVARAEKLGKKTVILSGTLGPGYEALLDKGSVAGVFGCGDAPTAKDALYSKTVQVFSDESFIGKLIEA